MIAWLLAQLLCLLDLQHCARLAWTRGGPRCVEVELAPRCEQRDGFHVVLGTAVCTRYCEDERPTR